MQITSGKCLYILWITMYYLLLYWNSFSLNNYPHRHVELSPCWSNAHMSALHISLHPQLLVQHGCADLQLLQELVVVTSTQWRWPITNVPAMAIWGDGVCGLSLKQHFHTAAWQLLYPLSHQPFVIADLINVAELWTVVEYAYCFLQFSWHCIAQSKLISMCCHGTAKCVTLFETLHSSLFALTQ